MQIATGESCVYPAGSVDLAHVEKFAVGSWEILAAAVVFTAAGSEKGNPRDAELGVDRKSDEAIVLMKQANKAAAVAAESVEGRAPMLGNARGESSARTQGRG